MHPFHRTELLVGRAGWSALKDARVLVVGLGGVGSYAAEAIARAGVSRIGLVDFDDVCVTNLNRQLHAFRRTVGQPKAKLMYQRVVSINPKSRVHVFPEFFDRDSAEAILAPGWDWVIDCIDNVTAKLDLLEMTWRAGTSVVSSMGAGGRLDPTQIRVSDLYDTRNDPLARVIRKQLRRRGVGRGIAAVWSAEPPNATDPEVAAAFECVCPNGDNGMHSCDDRNLVQGTVSFIPSMFGMAAAGAVVNALLGRPLVEDPRRASEVGSAALEPGAHPEDEPTLLAEALGGDAALAGASAE